MELRQSDGHERRAATRHVVTYRLDVLAPDGSAGCLLDISGTGMRVRFKQTLDIGSMNRLTILFPRWLELGEGLEVAGRFAWLRATPLGATEAGFAFDGLGRKQVGVLEVLIQRLGEALAEDRTEAA